MLVAHAPVNTTPMQASLVKLSVTHEKTGKQEGIVGKKGFSERGGWGKKIKIPHMHYETVKNVLK